LTITGVGEGFLGAEELDVGSWMPTSDSIRAVDQATNMKITRTIRMSTNGVTLKYNGPEPICLV
jgi:hypothetical protein